MIWQWDKAFDVQLSGGAPLKTGMFSLPAIVFLYRSKAGIFAVILGFPTCALPSPALRDNNGKNSGFKPVPLMG